MKKRKRIGITTISKILFHITFVVYALVVAATPILLGNADVINGFLGIQTEFGSGSTNGNMYFDTQFETMEQVHKASLDIIEETMAEGAVMLKNENGALPLSQGDTVNMYGLASYYSVHSGQGSSGTEGNALNDRVTLYEGLTNAGLTVNATLNEWYKSQSVSTHMGGNNFIGGSSQQSVYHVKDIAWNALNAAKNNEAKVGIMVLARNSGEAVDMYMDTTMDDGNTRVILNQYQSTASASIGDSLELTENEKSVLEGMKALKEKGDLESIVVIMNCASPLQSAFIDDEAYGIDACLWVGTIGTNGANAIGKLLTGEYNPSGRTTDTFWAESKYNPVYYNFGSIQYGNSGVLSSYFSNLGTVNNRYYTVYQESIYNGYKYTETRYEDVLTGRANAGEFDYSKVVSYPFGYGLSYSDFTYENMKVKANNNATYTVTVDVRNNSDVDGKEVVQVYLQKPYTDKDIENGVEKASVELIGFDKVEVPARGTVTATIVVEEKYFAAYDSNVEKTYVIGSSNESDKYLLTVAKDSHDAVNNILQYKKDLGVDVNTDQIYANAARGTGDKSLVWSKYFAYDNVTYSSNAFIKNENDIFTASYEGQQANYGVSSITNQFDDVDFQKAGYFSAEDISQSYMTRSNWVGTYGKRITLTATNALKEAQKTPAVQKDNIPYPTFGEVGFYEGADMFDEMKLIYLRGKDYNDPAWDILLDQMDWDEVCNLLQMGLRRTNALPSISAPSSSQQNGAIAPVHARPYSELPSQSGFRGFAELLDYEHRSQLPAVFTCNGIVAATYNTELIERLGVQTGEEAAWAGFNGIYGLGVNIHRGAYCGRTFEYYSEDGFLTGVAAGYEAVGMHKLGVFVLMKHAVLNDQETHRAGLNVWANEQSIREIYCRAIEVAVSIDNEYTPKPILGVMTGMNRMGAKWTGGQGFINTVLRAEYGMRGYAISDYNSSRYYMSPIQGVLYGNDLADGETAWTSRNGTDYDGNSSLFQSYKEGYGELAWSMRTAAKNILYTLVNSNTMNGITGDTSFYTVTPAWETALPVVKRVALTVFVWCAAGFAAAFVYQSIRDALKNKHDSANN